MLYCVLCSIQSTLYVVTAASLFTVQCRKISKIRTSLPLWEKYDIVNELNRRNDAPVSMLDEELEILRTSSITILKNKEKIIEDVETGCSSKTKRKRKHNFEAVDEPLVKWFSQASDKKIPVSAQMLLLKAQEYAEVCGCENPKQLSMSWINRWKMRKHIVCKKLYGEAESVDQNGVDEWQTNCLPALLKQFKAEDIFNADETRLFYRCLADRTPVFKNDKCAGGKLSKERFFCHIYPPFTRKRCIAMFWTVSPHSLGSCHFPVTCLPHKGGASR